MSSLSGKRLSGLGLIVAGLLFGSFMFLHPANNAQGALAAIWVPAHLMWFIAYLLIIFSFVPLYSATVGQGSWLVVASYWLSFMGTVLSLPIAVWDSFVIPYLARHAPDFIVQIEEVSTETSVLVFRIIVFVTILLFSVGFILFGITSMGLYRAPKLVGIGISLGAPLFWIGAFVVSKGAMGNRLTEIGAFLFGGGLLLLGKNLWATATVDQQ